MFISAEKKENLAELRDILINKIQEKHFLIYPNWDPTQNPLYDWQGTQEDFN